MVKVSDKLFRGPRPKDIRDFIDRGFEQIIVLQSGDEDKLTDSLYEAQLRAKRSDPDVYPEIEVVYIRCSNITPPKYEQVKSFLENVSKGKKTYLHCHSGVDRTGFLSAVYRMRVDKWTFKEAYNEWVKLGRHWWYDWWKYELRKYEASS